MQKSGHMSIKQPAIDSQTLLALSGLIGKICMEQNIDFMKCKQMNQDPRACLDKGGKVVSCVLMVMQTAEKKAASELKDLTRCLKVTSNDFIKCRHLKRAMEEAFNE